MNPHRPVLPALAILAAAMAIPAPVRAAAAYDNCTGYITTLPTIISTQGTWCMNVDLTTGIATGKAIEVTTNNVTIDCNDFKLGNLAAGAGTMTTGVYALSRQNVTVRRCNIRGFYAGMNVIGNGTLIEDNKVDGSTDSGIRVSGGGITIRRNQVTDTGNSTLAPNGVAIYAEGVVDVLDNTINGVSYLPAVDPGTAIGIAVSFNNGGSVRGNRIRDIDSSAGTGGFGSGIFVELDSQAVAIVDNVVHGLPGGGDSYGVFCDEAEMGLVRDNIVEDFDVNMATCHDIGNNWDTPL